MSNIDKFIKDNWITDEFTDDLESEECSGCGEEKTYINDEWICKECDKCEKCEKIVETYVHPYGCVRLCSDCGKNKCPENKHGKDTDDHCEKCFPHEEDEKKSKLD